MRTYQTLAVAAAIIAVTIVGLASPVFALVENTGNDRCYIVYTKLTNIVSAMHTVSDKREAAYKDAAARITRQLSAAKAAGYDTTQLQTDYRQLNTDILTFHTDRLTLEADLTNALSIAPTDCGSGSGKFVTALKTARSVLPTLRSDDAKIRSDIRAKLASDIRAYIAWLQQKASSASNT